MYSNIKHLKPFRDKKLAGIKVLFLVVFSDKKIKNRSL